MAKNIIFFFWGGKAFNDIKCVLFFSRRLPGKLFVIEFFLGFLMVLRVLSLLFQRFFDVF